MKRKYAPLLILLIHILVLILFHLFGYSGHFGYDDIHYADLANSLNHGIINFDDHASFRFSVIFFTAIAYRLFGVNDFASMLPAMIMAVSVLVLVFLVLKNKSLPTLIIGLSITSFTPWFLFYSDKLMPDFYVVFSVMLAVFIIYQFKYKSSKKYPAVYAILLVFSLLFGFMSKGTIVLVVPLLFYIFVIDLIKKRDVRFWVFVIGSGILVLGIYFLIIGLLTGDVAKRFHAIAQNSYLNLCSYDQQPIEFLIRRIAYEFFDMMVYQLMLVGVLFVVAAFFSKGGKRYFYLDDSFSFFLVSTLLLFLSSNFMTISLTSYVPMCLDPRHYLFLVPLAAIPAAEVITDFFRQKKRVVPILVLFVLVAVLSFVFYRDAFWKLYLPLTLLFFVFPLIQNKAIFKQFFIILFVGILLIKPATMVWSAQHFQYRKQRAVVYDHILNTHEKSIVITNDVQKRFGLYYAAFDDSSNVQFVNYDEFKPDSTDYRKKLLLLNYHTRTMTNQTMDDLPYYARNINEGNPLIFEDEGLGMAIYLLNTIEIPEVTGNELLHSYNDFEHSVAQWSQSEINDVLSANGSNSSKAGMYSSTFAMPFDSIAYQSFSSIVVAVKLNCYLEEKAKCSLVISLENKEGTYVWKGFGIEKHIKSYAHWWSVKHELTITVDAIKDSSLLKVYLLNPDQDEVYIDDFDVTVIGLK